MGPPAVPAVPASVVPASARGSTHPSQRHQSGSVPRLGPPLDASPARPLPPIRNHRERDGHTPLPVLAIPPLNELRDPFPVELPVELPARRQRPTWSDPRLATIESFAAPFRIEHAVNNLVVSNLRKGFQSYIPIAYFASRFADTSIKSIEAGESILIDDSGLKVKSKSFQDYAVSRITLSDFASIAVNFPRCIREHFIPTSGQMTTGSPLAHALADMFQAMFLMVQMRPDFEVCFEVYKEYVDRVLRQWHSFPERPMRIDIFHEGMYQLVFNTYQAKSFSLNTSTSSSTSSSSKSSSSSTSKTSKRGFRDNDDSRGGSRSSSRSTNRNVCYLCLSPDHHWTAHKAKKGDHLRKVDKRFVDSEGRPYCLAYNGVSGC